MEGTSSPASLQAVMRWNAGVVTIIAIENDDEILAALLGLFEMHGYSQSVGLVIC